jgi:hypothetical protein
MPFALEITALLAALVHPNHLYMFHGDSLVCRILAIPIILGIRTYAKPPSLYILSRYTASMASSGWLSGSILRKSYILYIKAEVKAARNTSKPCVGSICFFPLSNGIFSISPFQL